MPTHSRARALVAAVLPCPCPHPRRRPTAPGSARWSRQPAAGLGRRLLRPRRHPPRRSATRRSARSPASASAASKVRIELSNEYGDEPMTSAARSIAHGREPTAPSAGSDQAAHLRRRGLGDDPARRAGLERSGRPDAAALDSVAVSLYLPDSHPGDDLAQRRPPDRLHRRRRPDRRRQRQGRRHHQRAHLPERPPRRRQARGARAIVLFGDSITDGDGSTAEREQPLARRARRAHRRRPAPTSRC